MLIKSSNNDQRLHPFLESVAGQIRLRRLGLPDLTPIEFQSDLINIQGQLDGDCLFISNELHRARGIRKLHLEIARFGSSLEVLHCVFFPDPTYNIPIFGVDVVIAMKRISVSIVDLSPVSSELSQPIDEALSLLPNRSFKEVKNLPDWGSIFSKHVLFVRPVNNEEESTFLQSVDLYLGILIDSLSSLKPDEPNSADTIERIKFQHLYCQQQKRNDKTRNVLAKAFSPEWADKYIDTLLFECSSIL